MLRPLQGRHALKELGVSWGGSVPCGISACRNLRFWDSGLNPTRAESSAPVVLRSLRQQSMRSLSAAATRSTGAVCAGHRHATRMFAECTGPALLLDFLGPSLRRQ